MTRLKKGSYHPLVGEGVLETRFFYMHSHKSACFEGNRVMIPYSSPKTEFLQESQ